MTPDPIPSSGFGFILEVERQYTALIRCAAPAAREAGEDAEPTLGGTLLYAGELDSHGRALQVAGNIAGAASLAATGDLGAQKQAIRDGVADFLVISLDEALRILKNEIRKRETVAVCVGATPKDVEREMAERGVLPDLLGSQVKVAQAWSGQVLVTWSVESGPAQWLPKLDAVALDCLAQDSSFGARVARRWLRQAPRYLGRMAQGARLLWCEPDFAKEFTGRVRSGVSCGEIGVEVRVSVNRDEQVFPFKRPHPAH